MSPARIDRCPLLDDPLADLTQHEADDESGDVERHTAGCPARPAVRFQPLVPQPGYHSDQGDGESGVPVEEPEVGGHHSGDEAEQRRPLRPRRTAQQERQHGRGQHRPQIGDAVCDVREILDTGERQAEDDGRGGHQQRSPSHQRQRRRQQQPCPIGGDQDEPMQLEHGQVAQPDGQNRLVSPQVAGFFPAQGALHALGEGLQLGAVTPVRFLPEASQQHGVHQRAVSGVPVRAPHDPQRELAELVSEQWPFATEVPVAHRGLFELFGKPLLRQLVWNLVTGVVQEKAHRRPGHCNGCVQDQPPPEGPRGEVIGATGDRVGSTRLGGHPIPWRGGGAAPPSWTVDGFRLVYGDGRESVRPVEPLVPDRGPDAFRHYGSSLSLRIVRSLWTRPASIAR